VVAVAPNELGSAPEPDPPSAPPVKPSPVVVNGRIAWTEFDERELERQLDAGRPVFVFFTADWCVNCKVLEKHVLETDGVHQALKASGALPMRADFTEESEMIERWIARLGRGGVPICGILRPDGRRNILPEVATVDMVASALRAASP
jgi:thiol:disulfide interchange protein